MRNPVASGATLTWTLENPPTFSSASALVRIFSSEYGSPGLSVTQARNGPRSRWGLANRDTAPTVCPS